MAVARILAVAVLHAAAAAALAVASCGGGSSAEPVRLYAAASMRDVLDEAARAFEARTGTHVATSYGASGTLAQQILGGAPPGVFVSASEDWAGRVEKDGLAEPGSRADLCGNRLVVVVPRRDADPVLQDAPGILEDLAGERAGTIALADVRAAPAGAAAKQALETAGLWERVRTRIVEAADVRGALAYVERGEADAAIVYATDAKSSGRVRVACDVPPALHPRIRYPVLLVRGAPDGARALHEFLLGPESRALLDRAGFTR